MMLSDLFEGVGMVEGDAPDHPDLMAWIGGTSATIGKALPSQQCAHHVQ